MREIVGRPIELILALILIYSSFIHSNNPYVFLESVFQYKIVFGLWAIGVAVSIPIIQLVLGTCLILRFSPSISLLSAMTMFLMFVIVQISAVARDLKIDCGCFGPGASPISMKTISLAIGCFMLAAICLFVERRLPRLQKLPSTESAA